MNKQAYELLIKVARSLDGDVMSKEAASFVYPYAQATMKAAPKATEKVIAIIGDLMNKAKSVASTGSKAVKKGVKGAGKAVQNTAKKTKKSITPKKVYDPASDYVSAGSDMGVNGDPLPNTLTQYGMIGAHRAKETGKEVGKKVRRGVGDAVEYVNTNKKPLSIGFGTGVGVGTGAGVGLSELVRYIRNSKANQSNQE